MNYSMFSESKHLVEKKLKSVLSDLSSKYEIDKVVYNGNDKEFNISTLLNDLNTMPFLSDHKVIILENPFFFSSKAGLSDNENNLLISCGSDSHGMEEDSGHGSLGSMSLDKESLEKFINAVK